VKHQGRKKEHVAGLCRIPIAFAGKEMPSWKICCTGAKELCSLEAADFIDAKP